MQKNIDYITKNNIRRAVSYIKETRKQGYSNKIIMDELLKAGYDGKIVKNAFASLSKEKLITVVLGAIFFFCIIVAIFSALKLLKFL